MNRSSLIRNLTAQRSCRLWGKIGNRTLFPQLRCFAYFDNSKRYLLFVFFFFIFMTQGNIVTVLFIFFSSLPPSSPQTPKPDLLFSFWCRFYTVAEFNAIKWPCYSGIVYLSFRSARSECNGGVERNAIACFLLDGKQRVRARGWSSNSFFSLFYFFLRKKPQGECF